MSLPRLALAVIGDEIGPSLDEMISFCQEHEVRRLDMRTVGGRNLLSMNLEEASSIARTIEKAGLQVPTFVSPLLKWPAEGTGRCAASSSQYRTWVTTSSRRSSFSRLSCVICPSWPRKTLKIKR